MRQYLKRFQLVVVDNGSNPDYINSLGSLRYPLRAKILKSDSANIFEMCNEGLRAAQGKYVVFATGDDIFLDNFLQSLYSSAEQNKADVVYPFNYGIPVDNEALKVNLDKKVFKIDARIHTDEKAWNFEEALYELNDKNLMLRLQGFLDGVFYPSIFNKLIRQDFLINNDINFSTDTSIPEWLFCVKCLCLAEKYIRVPEVLYLQLQKRNFKIDSHRTIAGIEELENFLASINSFKDIFVDNKRDQDNFSAIEGSI